DRYERSICGRKSILNRRQEVGYNIEFRIAKQGRANELIYLLEHFLQRFPFLYFLQHFFRMQQENSPKAFRPFCFSSQSTSGWLIRLSSCRFIAQIYIII